MTPDELQKFNELVKKVDDFIDIYSRSHFIDKDVFNNKVYFRNDVYLPSKTAFFGSNTPASKQAAITTPSGGATVDSQARSAISSIITTLQSLGLTL